MSSAEDPEKLLDQVVQEMQGDLIRMRQAAAQVCDASSPFLLCVLSSSIELCT